jgi:aspartyl-tRNA(Asn)/glutamyl-tRNA(Gln) amidotransferase subunit B
VTVAERYETVIGLEVHVQLATRTKLFCGCEVAFGAPPNSRTCPVCAGHPGVLPVPNERAIELAIRAALALGCTVAAKTKFDRKNYFYPDLPKGYQISQFDEPLAHDGVIGLASGKQAGIERVHVEEDAGKTMHAPAGSLVDLNRAGVPLVEIVGRPDLRTPAEAHEYLGLLKQTLRYAGVSDCDMEKGSLRCDANVSLRESGAEQLGTKVEIKNLNSFKMVERALEYERTRQAILLDRGERVAQESRLWNDEHGETRPMRSKEFAHDYRYFPEPDIPPIHVARAVVDRIRGELPELPGPRARRFAAEYGIPAYDIGVLVAERPVADYFEVVARACGDPKAASNWVMTEVLRALNEAGGRIEEFPVPAAALAELLGLVRSGAVNLQGAKKAFARMVATREAPRAAIAALGLEQISDAGALAPVVKDVLAGAPKVVADLRAGKTKALDALKGMVMRATRGKADPALVDELIRAELRRE